MSVIALDSIQQEIRFAMVLGGSRSENRDLDRVFQFGTFQGRPHKLVLIAAGDEKESSFPIEPKLCAVSEFEATIAQYDADPRWSRIA